MRSHISYQILTAVCLVCLWAMVCAGLNGFTPAAIAQDLPTPTTTPTVTGTPDPDATAPSPSGTPATPTGRAIDFRVDDREVSPGECVTFGWLVKGDIDKIEFDQHDDSKNPILVPEEQYDTEKCPTETTEYILIVSWLDGTQTKQTIKIEVEASNDHQDHQDHEDNGSDDGTNQSVTVTGTAANFIAVTPLPISGMSGGGGGQAATPQSVAYQGTTGAVVVTPVGVLGSVELLPETGYGPPPAVSEFQVSNGLSLAYLRGHFKICPAPVWPR